ncbi:hypothetical protein RJ640_023663 [Escallonia rubra]|uniref:Uncharacterized protein n=1 Tax=Escallonia rubra TaxID=112253 RepID=A0AA88R573_9ASTE|nr:hypothetical protein RJ640_023663 [Escallonia rubra]
MGTMVSMFRFSYLAIPFFIPEIIITSTPLPEQISAHMGRRSSSTQLEDSVTVAGRLIPDFIAEYAKLPLIPPYLQPGNHQFGYGANFASGGAGALDETFPGLVCDVLIRYFVPKNNEAVPIQGAGAWRRLHRRRDPLRLPPACPPAPPGQARPVRHLPRRLPPACPPGLSNISLPIEDTRPPPSHLQPGNHQFGYGANFASGGAGALDETFPGLYVTVSNPNRDAFTHYDSSLQLAYFGAPVGFIFILQ